MTDPNVRQEAEEVNVVQLPTTAPIPKPSLEDRLDTAKAKWTWIQNNHLDVIAMLLLVPLAGIAAAIVKLQVQHIIYLLAVITFPTWWFRTRDVSIAAQSAIILGSGGIGLVYAAWGPQTSIAEIALGALWYALCAYLCIKNLRGS